MVFTEVAPGVVSAEHRVVEGKNGIVFGAQRALAIDAGMFPEEGDATAGFIRERGYEPGLLVLTHGHGDHALGSGAFRAAVVVAHIGTPRVMRRQLPGWAVRAG
ncbi:MAG: MBL fold metallo-hydrolase, partial [Chloroflexota bacterium]